MTNQQRPDEEGDTLTRGGTEPIDAAGPASDPEPPHDPSPDPETVDPARAEPIGAAAPAPRREGGVSRVAGVLLIVVLTLIAAGFGAALGPLIHPAARQGDGDVAALATRVTALEAQAADQAKLAQGLDGLRQDLAALQQKVATLETAPATSTDVTATPPELDKRLGGLEQALTTLVGRVDGALQQQLAGKDPAFAAGGTAGAATEESLAAEVAALQESVSELDAGAVDGERVAALADRLDALDMKLSELVATAESVATLRQEVTALQERAADPRAAFALAAGQLREAVLTGEAYAEPLATAEGLAPDDAEARRALAALVPWQQQGVATRARLAAALDAAAHAAVDAARTDAAQGWFDKTLAELASIVSIRRVDGEAGGTGADNVTSRAEARLDQGDLAGAIEEMAALQGTAGEAAAGWLEIARSRLAAEQAVATLSARALALLEGGA